MKCAGCTGHCATIFHVSTYCGLSCQSIIEKVFRNERAWRSFSLAVKLMNGVPVLWNVSTQLWRMRKAHMRDRLDQIEQTNVFRFILVLRTDAWVLRNGIVDEDVRKSPPIPHMSKFSAIITSKWSSLRRFTNCVSSKSPLHCRTNWSA